MSGPAPKPPDQRRRRNKPARGEWVASDNVGWQHGDIPAPPGGLLQSSRAAWETWLRAWFAARWLTSDLPGLRLLIRTYDQVERGEFQRGPELRMLMDTYGITPKGQQERRWAPPKVEDAPQASAAESPYAHLRVVNE